MMKFSLKKAITKYKSMPEPAKASGAYIVCNVLQKSILMITTPIFTRLLTTDQYGEVNLFNTWLAIINIFASLKVASGGYGAGLVRFSDEKDRYVSSVQGVSMLFTVGEFALFTLGYYIFKGEIFSMNYFIPMAILYVLFSTPVDLWTGRERFDFKYRKVVALTLITVTLNPIIGIILVKSATEKGVARIISIVAVQAMVGVVAIFINQKRGEAFYDKKYWSFILKMNIPLIPHYLAQIVLAQSDRLMIGDMCGKTEVAIYGLAYTLGMIMLFVSDAISASFTPWLYRKIKAGDLSKVAEYTNLITLLVGLAVMVPVLFAPELVLFLGGRNYMEGIWIVPSVAMAAFFIYVYGLFANVQFYYGESKRTMVASLVAAGLNVGLNWLLIRPFGYIAAGYTTAVTYFVLVIFHYFFMKAVLKKNHMEEKIYNNKLLFVYCLIGVVVSGISMLSYNHTIMRYSMIAVLMVVAFIKRDALFEVLNLRKSTEE